ncbi:alkene reductase [Roseibacillus persicicus]|uniref:alkene reductase n=1 Tax=Roseibacillus persicicus TaxID=454148 RepID=UPI00398BB70B
MKLFEPLELSPGLTLPNRIVMAPLTRDRAGEGNVPTELMAEYYRQRASFGLIISEATPVNAAGHGYPATPGIHTPEQIEGWKKVTAAVHEAGGRIFCQLWHCGRISHPAYQPKGKFPPAPSPIGARDSQIWKPDWTPVDKVVKPKEMTPDDIDFTVEDYRKATRAAREAGFDGVEIHGANGYLVNQFLAENSNKRKDEYGGSIENRARFLFEVLDAVTTEWPDRVALRLSPPGTFNDIDAKNAEPLYKHVIDKLNEYDLAYLHLVEPRMFADYDLSTYDLPLSSKTWRPIFKGTLISSGGHLKESASVLLNHAQADLIAFGRLAISNPDLPRRFELDAPLNDYDRDSFYGGTEVGYTDYPTLEQVEADPSLKKPYLHERPEKAVEEVTDLASEEEEKTPDDNPSQASSSHESEPPPAAEPSEAGEPKPTTKPAPEIDFVEETFNLGDPKDSA